MKYFKFDSLIKKYSSEFKVITFANGYYNDMGDWVKGDELETSLVGAIISFTENKIYRSSGLLTSQDRRLFMLEPIPDALKSSKVIHDNKVYSIESSHDDAKFTGVWLYTLKWVSAFNGEDNHD